MSAAFKLAKKKVSQHDLRKMFAEQKQTRSKESLTIKIDSPFAKYDNGQLNCQLCKSVVRSEAVWKVHINTKQHKENLALAKELREKLEKQSKAPAMEERLAALKRMRIETETPQHQTKLKGILKNSSSSVQVPESSNENVNPAATSTTSTIPDDFFDAKPNHASTEKKPEKSSKEPDEDMQVDEAIPEGFFDDPKKDAKARHLEYKDPVEEEWDKFQKEIKEAEVTSMNIIHEEQEEATVERQIDEIDAQIKNWSRVLKLEKKKEQIESKLKREMLQPEQPEADCHTSSEEEEEDEVVEFDWRAKKTKKK